MKLRRRSMIQSGLLAATFGSSARAAGPTMLRYAPSAEPRVLDPVVSPLAITHEHAYLVYDTLFSLDAQFQPQPQMVDTFQTSADGKVLTMTLRPGLRFHDGSPVTSADVVASVKRWAARDTTGRRLIALGLVLDAPDAATVKMTMPRPTALLLEALAKPTATALFIMRAADAASSPTQAVKEIVGSGPFRFVAAEYRPGDRLVYARNNDYVPRSESPSYFAGGKVAKVDRVEWIIEPDSGTAVAALQKDEIDIYESPPMDLVPLLRKQPGVTVEVHGKQGAVGFLRFNLTQPPFDKPEARRGLAMLLDQGDFMEAVSGGDQDYWKHCYSFTGCGGRNEAKDTSGVPHAPALAEAKALFAQAGYTGAPIVFIAPGDNEVIKTFAVVAAGRMKEAGLHVDLQFSDFGTMMARRANRGPTTQGGWNLFPMWSFGSELDNPVANFVLSADCSDGAYAGWACERTLENLKDQWTWELDPQKRAALIEKIQQQASQLVPIVPLGQFFAPIAFRKSVTGLLPTPLPVFWNVEKH